MLRTRIETDMKAAMKAQDRKQLEVLRYIWSAIKNEEIDLKREMRDEEVVSLLQTEVKRRKQAIEQFEAASRDELVADELSQLEVIDVYLPDELTEDEITQIIDAVIADGGGDFGQVMGQVMGQVKGRADGGMVARLVKAQLS